MESMLINWVRENEALFFRLHARAILVLMLATLTKAIKEPLFSSGPLAPEGLPSD